MDLQTAAPRRPVVSERGDEDEPAWPNGSTYLNDVRCPIGRLCEKMKDGPVMPDRITTLRKRGAENVGLDPSNGICLRSEAGAGFGKRCGREIENGEIEVAGVQEIIDQGGCTSAHINDRSVWRRADPANQIQRAQGVRLVPADLGRELGAVNALPVRLGIHFAVPLARSWF